MQSSFRYMDSYYSKLIGSADIFDLSLKITRQTFKSITVRETHLFIFLSLIFH